MQKTTEQEKYIAVIDSGFGGLSVLKRLIELMPDENFIFYGDSKNAPYGVRTREEIIALSERIVEALLPYNIKQLIIACNTISVTATEILRKKYPNLSIIPTTPNVKSVIMKEGLEQKKEIPIPRQDSKKKVLIIATPSTCKSEFVKKEVEKHKDVLDIFIKPANPLVHFVENLKAESKECEDYLRNDLLVDYKDIDYLILGCTHFPFVTKNINKVYQDSNVELIDNAIFVARNAKDYLEKNGMLKSEDQCRNKENMNLKIIDTKGGKDRQEMFSKLLEINLEKLEFI